MIDQSVGEDLLASDVVAFRAGRDIITAIGPDAGEYLHGQVSQAITSMADGSSAWTFLLDPQGRIAAWMRVTRLDDQNYWLDMDPGAGEAALARLERFKLRVDVTFELSTSEVISVRGPNADSATATAGVVASLSWPDTPGFDLLGPDAEIPDGIEEADASLLEAHRIALRIPSMGREIGEKTIPAELGVVEMSADFTKGCYVGQELVARVDSRGNNTPRTMRALTFDALPTDALPLPLFQGDDKVGVLTSAASLGSGVVGLASIKRAADLDQQVAVGAGGALATIEP